MELEIINEKTNKERPKLNQSYMDPKENSKKLNFEKKSKKNNTAHVGQRVPNVKNPGIVTEDDSPESPKDSMFQNNMIVKNRKSNFFNNHNPTSTPSKMLLSPTVINSRPANPNKGNRNSMFSMVSESYNVFDNSLASKQIDSPDNSSKDDSSKSSNQETDKSDSLSVADSQTMPQYHSPLKINILKPENENSPKKQNYDTISGDIFTPDFTKKSYGAEFITNSKRQYSKDINPIINDTIYECDEILENSLVTNNQVSILKDNTASNINSNGFSSLFNPIKKESDSLIREKDFGDNTGRSNSSIQMGIKYDSD